MEEELKRMADGDVSFWKSGALPRDVWETNLEDILAFESVGSGKSLFEGLQEHGVDLPRPEKLDEKQCADKIKEVTLALVRLQIMLVGYEDMTIREFYATLWNQTLWEGCYVEKRNPGAMTIIDVSHRLSHSEMLSILEEFQKSGAVH
ncbi:MAG: hypothetical protein H6Q05_909 [Acidobacteria bacterium]|nr:hypothetical protein [Acidobacteriota bacterium]